MSKLRKKAAALYCLSRKWEPAKWTRESGEILEVLTLDSPLSTRQIKEAVDLKGKLLESTYERAMKPLWQHFDIVGFGEVEDSSFPSLAVGATVTLFEDLVEEAKQLSEEEAMKHFRRCFPEKSLWLKFWKRISTNDHQ